MTLYPLDLERRFAATIRAMQERIAKLESRTAGIDSGYPLALLPATIDPSYSSGDPYAYINNSPNLTGPYYHLSSYTPVASDLVVVAPIGGGMNTYVVLGKLV